MDSARVSFVICCMFIACSMLVEVVAGKSNVHVIYLGSSRQRTNGNEKDLHRNLLTSVLGSNEKADEAIVYSYEWGFSGFAAKLTEAQAQRLSVIKVLPNTMHRMQTTRSWDFLGVPHAPSSCLNKSNLGDGVIIGILDTGIWPESRSFNDELLGPVPTRWRGSCDWGSESGSATLCNKKIIGSRWYINGLLAEFGPPSNTTGINEFLSPRDGVGHGTHTASTAAGSVVSNVTFEGVGTGNARGGDTLARLAIYKVCWNTLIGGVCTTVDILKAFDDAIHDGVHVLSLSLGPAQDTFEMDGIAVGSLHAVMEGITVVCAGGNSGPSPQSVTNTAPWIITVAASTMDRSFQAPITLGNNETFWGQTIYTGKPIGYESLTFMEESLAYENNSTSDRDCDAIAGKVVFTSMNPNPGNPISASLVGFKVKSCHGLGVVVATDPDDDVGTFFHDFPFIQVDYEIGVRILHYIQSEKSPTVKLSPTRTLIGKSIAPRVAPFSSRGPNYVAPAILKPDITAPGVNFLAAVPSNFDGADNGYAILSGTSMSTPHVAGIVAILKSQHPDWSPGAIRSAMVTTATVYRPFPYPLLAGASPQKIADPFDMGGGIVDPTAAADPGLIYDTSLTDYIRYVCAMGYENSSLSQLIHEARCPRTKPSILDINLPSITIPGLEDVTRVRRTVTNVGHPKSVYQVEVEPPPGTAVMVRPRVLVFGQGIRKQRFEVEVTAKARERTDAGYYFGSMTWRDGVHSVRIPIAVRMVTRSPFSTP